MGEYGVWDAVGYLAANNGRAPTMSTRLRRAPSAVRRASRHGVRSGSCNPPGDVIRRRTMTASEWNATAYDRVSTPQQDWGLKVLDRLELAGDEVAADVGCGTGRVTAALAARLP